MGHWLVHFSCSKSNQNQFNLPLLSSQDKVFKCFLLILILIVIFPTQFLTNRACYPEDYWRELCSYVVGQYRGIGLPWLLRLDSNCKEPCWTDPDPPPVDGRNVETDNDLGVQKVVE